VPERYVRSNQGTPKSLAETSCLLADGSQGREAIGITPRGTGRPAIRLFFMPRGPRQGFMAAKPKKLDGYLSSPDWKRRSGKAARRRKIPLRYWLKSLVKSRYPCHESQNSLHGLELREIKNEVFYAVKCYFAVPT